MTDREVPAPLPTSEERQKVEAELCEHFAAGHIELDELERRLAVVEQTRSGAELVNLVQDLQPLPAAPIQAPVEPEKRGWALALMGGSARKGKWVPPRNLNAVAVMGGVDLDFREAILGPGLTQVNAVAVMGGIDIIVPPDMTVTVRGLGIMGAVEQVEQHATESERATPALRVNALALMGGIDVKTRQREGAEKPVSKKRGELNR